MNTVKVKKEEVLKKLKKNRDRHANMVRKSTEGYRQEVKKVLSEMLTKIDAGQDFNRNDLLNLTPPVDKTEEYDEVELQEFSSEDGTFLSVELWESWFTFYLGEPIERGDVNVFPMEPTESEE